TPNPNCLSDSTVIVTIYALPPVHAGTDQTVCAGTSAVLSGSGATSYQWNSGLVDGQTFTPPATQTYTVTGTDANGCQNTDQVMITVVPIDDPSFGYPGGNAYCEDHGTILPNITGLSGGTFSYSPNTAGNVLDLNTTNGE